GRSMVNRPTVKLPFIVGFTAVGPSNRTTTPAPVGGAARPPFTTLGQLVAVPGPGQGEGWGVGRWGGARSMKLGAGRGGGVRGCGGGGAGEAGAGSMKVAGSRRGVVMASGGGGEGREPPNYHGVRRRFNQESCDIFRDSSGCPRCRRTACQSVTCHEVRS